MRLWSVIAIGLENGEVKTSPRCHRTIEAEERWEPVGSVTAATIERESVVIIC